MSDHLDERVDSIVAEVLRRRSQHLPDGLDELCSDDVELRTRVEQNLVADEQAMELLRDLGQPIAERTQPSFVGEFEIKSLLGSGASANVYLAHQPSLSRDVALKVFDRHRFSDPRSKQRVLREATIGASLDHPNIVPVYAVGEEDGRLYIAMKKLTGPGLDELTPRAPKEVARIGLAVANALIHAHAAGIIHRDIKPANIVFDGDNPSVVDFGLARADDDVKLTSRDAAPGTLAYMAPERLRGHEDQVTPSSDIYALAATMYQILAAHPPFLAESPERMIHRILFREAQPLGLQGQDADLETLVMRGLEKEHGRRFDSARALAEELERYLDGRPIRSKPIGLTTRWWRRARRHPRTSTAAASVAVALLAFTGWQIDRGLEERAQEAEVRAGIRAHLAAGELGAAREQLATLAALRRPAADLERDATLLESLEELFDNVQDRPSGWMSTRADELADQADEVHRLSPRWRRRLVLLLAIQATATKDHERARTLLAALEPGRDTRSIQALIDGTEIDPNPGDDLDQEVFVAICLRAAGFDPIVRLHHLESLGPAARGDYRLNVAKAIAWSDRLKIETATELFQMLDGVRRDRPIVVRNLARMAFLRGDFDGARRELGRLPTRETPEAMNIEAEIARREGREADWLALAGEAHDRWPSDPRVALQLGNAVSRTDPSRSRELFALAAENSWFEQVRVRARIKLLLTELREHDLKPLGNFGRPASLTAEQQQEAERIRAAAESLCDRCHRFNLSQCLLIRAWIARLLSPNQPDDVGDYEELLREAYDAAPDNPPLLAELAAYAFQRSVLALRKGATIDDVVVATHAQTLTLGLEAAKTLLTLTTGTGGMIASTSEQRIGAIANAVLSHVLRYRDAEVLSALDVARQDEYLPPGLNPLPDDIERAHL